MNNIWFASHNAHKIEELHALLNPLGWNIRGIEEAGLTAEIEESGIDLRENAFIKAKYAYDHLKEPCISDDSGLEVEILNGRPGVHSARFAGLPADNQRNMSQLLRMMQGQSNRKAQFRTVICMIRNDSTYYFEGCVGGNITLEPRGAGGFGYDPIFIPEGHTLTFAEMTPTQKNGISHRARAVSNWIEFLREIL